LRSINLRPLLIVAALLGGALLLVINVRVALGVGESLPEAPSPAPSVSSPNPWVAGPVQFPDAGSGDGPATRALQARSAARPSPASRSSSQPTSSDATPPASPVSAPGDDASGDTQADATRKACMDGMAEAQKLAAVLPADDPSRYFAERNLQQAQMEAGNGEFDECQEWAERAVDEVKEHRHTLAPGEKLKILRPDE
jgi:hypothetical protein